MKVERFARWRFALLMSTPLIAVLPELIRDRQSFGALWLLNEGAFEQIALLFAAVTLMAALLAGVRAWKSLHA